MLRRLLFGLIALIALAVAFVSVFVASRQNLKFDAPMPAVEASADSAVIARGQYVARQLAPCASCHGDPGRNEEILAGAEVPLSGGYVFDIPPGQFHVPNITPDPETGLGRVSDGAVARALRFGVGHDGRALLPFMEMQGLSDEDLLAVVSYLRTQAPVANPVPAHGYSLLGKVLKATMFARAVGPTGTPPAMSPRGATEENGRYLVESVALCASCHTQRDLRNGQLVGPRFGGATGLEDHDKSRTWSPPNITSDPSTGRLAAFTEDQWVERFRAGRVIPGSPMPWAGYQKLDEDDLRAIYRYLKTVPPVTRDVGPAIVDVAK